ncbi:MAG: HipA domain-containing protein [Natronospirillum sp.]
MTTNTPPTAACLISLEPLRPKQTHAGYNDSAYHELFGTLAVRAELPFTRQQFFTEGRQFVKGMSISGVQQKLSLTIDKGSLTYTAQGGQFILKPSPEIFPNAAENEHAAMTLARSMGFDTALCGLVRFNGSSELAYITRRYDRSSTGPKHQESLLSAAGLHSDKKYDISYEQAAREVASVANGRKALVLEFIRRVMFCYYIGNSDAHAMNFSFMRPTEAGSTDADIQLSPIYDVLFTHAFPAEGNLSALALDLLDDGNGGEFFTPQFERLGFYSLTDFIELGRRVGIPAKPIIKFAEQIITGLPLHTALVERSHIPDGMKKTVCALLADRAKALSPRLAV